ncbi:secretion protein [Azotobacter vinelandii CA]|uniref:Secretion protein n=2 Tax=Azotobacter vinelandii TaxID=354 RepID=C1DI12_AZOVD|nr:HlyD family secretion protein [Azotobacter vinelandii]ACO80745.1 secretion protein [Azotobacter vinelandii DJ]AGK14294.1 secretion protein [Azotobacter vinelandii CA]AGK22123.1 secretion protein [Azotobacter vinelandii CA6]SFX04512.1 membrane fusion protein, multidrug efflux system [Azotobacter vinelandii]GLK60775.1 secretion protein [Azotobacter vinelandii]
MLMTRRTSLLLVALVLCALAGLLAFLLLRPVRWQATDNAYVRADYTLVAPKISGHVVELLVDDNQFVHRGQLLARIDPRDYESELASAEARVAAAEAGLRRIAADLEQQGSRIAAAQARVAAAQAEHDFARQELKRYESLASQGAGSLQLAQQARSRIGTSRAALEEARAALASEEQQVAVLQARQGEAGAALQRAGADRHHAELRLSYTRIEAPLDGVVGRRSVRVGAYVQPGNALLAVVPLDAVYVVANYQETQLTEVQPGQAVEVSVDTFPGAPLRARVDSFAPATGLSFAPVVPSNATGNFTKIVQRIPVKIRFEPDQPQVEKLRVGMSVVTRIDVRSAAPQPGQRNASR